MKPEPVRPLHRSILGAQKNCRLPLISKKVGPGPQPLPLGCCQEPSGHGLPAAKFTLSGQNKALESALQVEIQSHFPQSSRSAAADPAPKRRPPEPAKSRVHGGCVRGLRPAPCSASPTSGNPSSPMVAALISSHVHPGDGWNFP